MAVSLGSYFSPVGRQTDFPSVDGAFGWTNRVQVGLTVPYSRFQTIDGQTVSGRGDIYLSSKISLWDRTAAGSGKAVAITPLLEVLSEPDPFKGGRLFWAIPISGEVRRSGYRLYGSGGYFSRGVLFGGGALEVPLNERLVTTAALTWTRSLASDPLADTLGMSAGRTDMSDEMQALCFFAGANSIFVGETLLTAGNPDEDKDARLFQRLGLEPMALERHS